MKVTAGGKDTVGDMQRVVQSIPASYTIWKDGTTYRAECNIAGGTDYGPLADVTTVIQAASDALPNGGKIVLKGPNSTWGTSGTITLAHPLTVEGEVQGDDTNFGCPILHRTTDAPIFAIQSDRVHLKNLILKGELAHTTFFVTCSGPKRFTETENMTYWINGGGGIDLNGNYWCQLRNTWGVTLGDYCIKNIAGSPVAIEIDGVIGFQTKGLVYLGTVMGFQIRNPAMDYFAGITNSCLKIVSSVGTIEGLDLEGDAVAGMPVHGVELSLSNVQIRGSRFWYCGDLAGHMPINLWQSKLDLTATTFSNAMAPYDIDMDVASRFDFGHALVWAAGPHYVLEKSGTAEASNTDTVPFGATFIVAPNSVTITVNENDARYIAQAYNITQTGFDLYLYDETADALEVVDKTVSWKAEYTL